MSYGLFRRRFLKSLLVFVLLPFTQPSMSLAQDDYDFDLSEFEPKPYDFDGFAGFTPGLSFVNNESAWWKYNYYDREDEFIDSYEFELLAQGSYNYKGVKLSGRAQEMLTYGIDDRQDDFTLQEGYLLSQQTPAAAFYLGKKVLKWGKGYAFNPAAVLDRPKDPDDPDLSLEGFWLTAFEVIKSFEAPLTTTALTVAVLPVNGKVNDDYNSAEGVNLAAKLYLLLYNFDFDIIYSVSAYDSPRIAFDFSGNVLPNLEIHGESAYSGRRQRPIYENGSFARRERSSFAGLVGVRYLSQTDTTMILEYYRNQSGYLSHELADFYEQAKQAEYIYRTTGNEQRLTTIRAVGKAGYRGANPGRDYLFLKVSQPEPLGVVYSSLALVTLANAGDGSYSLTPEAIYTGFNDLELRLRISWIDGPRLSDYGERIYHARALLRARYFF